MNKKEYMSPIIERIILDSDISLSMESENPPEYDNEGYLSPNYLNTDQNKTYMA